MELIEDQNEVATESYLTFKLGEEHFCISVSSVAKILEMTEITKVPESPDYMKGIINLRGNILPVIDTRLKFKLEPKEYDLRTRILVLDIESQNKVLTIGAVVDLAREVIAVNPDDILPPPSLEDYERADYIDGVINHNEAFIMIVNINKLFAKNELAIMESVED